MREFRAVGREIAFTGTGLTIQNSNLNYPAPCPSATGSNLRPRAPSPTASSLCSPSAAPPFTKSGSWPTAQAVDPAPPILR